MNIALITDKVNGLPALELNMSAALPVLIEIDTDNNHQALSQRITIVNSNQMNIFMAGLHLTPTTTVLTVIRREMYTLEMMIVEFTLLIMIRETSTSW